MGFHFVVLFIDYFVDDVTFERDVGSLCGVYDLLHTGVYLLWL
jgi:hypothetical protein